ncbi:MAG: hypothetical protein L6R48_10935 [Planctomycetes bacterium]|nr:hypothetical protein [Planctomycetota bacterium]
MRTAPPITEAPSTPSMAPGQAAYLAWCGGLEDTLRWCLILPQAERIRRAELRAWARRGRDDGIADAERARRIAADFDAMADWLRRKAFPRTEDRKIIDILTQGRDAEAALALSGAMARREILAGMPGRAALYAKTLISARKPGKTPEERDAQANAAAKDWAA